MTIKRITLSLCIFLFCHPAGFTQALDLSKYQLPFNVRGVTHYHLNSDGLSPEKQNVEIIAIGRKAMSTLKFGIGYSDSILKRTSQFAEETKAIVALNGSFFDVKKGGSVAYLESGGKVIAWNRNSKQPWAKTDSLLNGAILVSHKFRLNVEVAKTSAAYEESTKEEAVLVSGPILLIGGKKMPLENSEFVKKRHPRSCLCKTADKRILFIAIDGRSALASGMNLGEAQDFLLRLSCRDAINLDGGGSTTLWMNDGKEKGILNRPSDKEGERPVANIIFVAN
jgi:exopolysaccharide biosynthesis protein